MRDYPHLRPQKFTNISTPCFYHPTSSVNHYGFLCGSHSFPAYACVILTVYQPTNSFYCRFSCLCTETCVVQVRNARNEPYHDRGWHCFLEKEGGRVIHYRGCSSRDCTLLINSKSFMSLSHSSSVLGNGQGYDRRRSTRRWYHG